MPAERIASRVISGAAGVSKDANKGQTQQHSPLQM